MVLNTSECAEVDPIYMRSIKHVLIKAELLIFIGWSLKINLDHKPQLLFMRSNIISRKIHIEVGHEKKETVP